MNIVLYQIFIHEYRALSDIQHSRCALLTPTRALKAVSSDRDGS
jgi:hypothetical protein